MELDGNIYLANNILYMNSKISCLVLDYAKPKQTKQCLQSIKEKLTAEHETILLSNGICEGKMLGESPRDYAVDFVFNGLMDQLIINKENNGCGNGTDQLFRAANTEWALYVQNDQVLVGALNQGIINGFIDFLTERTEFLCIDLAGGQAGVNTYSERAHFINVKRYREIFKGKSGEIGGPGPFNFNKYSEQYVQEYCQLKGLNIAVGPRVFADCGVTSIREIGDGIYEHRCDTKQLWIHKRPTYKTETYPPFNEEEWQLALNGKWVNGTIPEQWKSHSFKVWQ